MNQPNSDRPALGNFLSTKLSKAHNGLLREKDCKRAMQIHLGTKKKERRKRKSAVNGNAPCEAVGALKISRAVMIYSLEDPRKFYEGFSLKVT